VIDFAVLMIAFFLLTYCLGTGLDYILIPNSVLYLGVLFELMYYFFWLFRTYSGIIRHLLY
jgi:hypothetical protein